MRNFVYYTNPSYSGGLNNTDIPENLKKDQSPDIRNADIRTIGSISTRGGALQQGDDTGNTAIVGEYHWTTTAGTKYRLRMTGTNLQYLNSATWTTMDSGFTTGLSTTFVPANGKLYILNGTDNIHSWDGAAVTLNSCLTDMGATNVPKAKYGIWWKNYMFLWGGVSLNGTAYKSRCYFSNLGDADTYTHATDYFDVFAQDGQDATGIGAIGDFLVLFKRYSIRFMTGSNPSDWIISGSNNKLGSLLVGIGCTSGKSICQPGNDLWFMSDDGIRSVARSEEGGSLAAGIVTGNVEATIAGMNKGALDKVVASIWNKKVYYAFPAGSSTYNNQILVADTTIDTGNPINPHPWVLYTGWNVGDFAVGIPSNQPVLYFGEGSANSLSFIAETGTNDNSAAIDFYYESPLIDLQEPGMRKTTRFAKIEGDSVGNYGISVNTSTDGTEFTNHGTLTLSSGVVWNSATWDTDDWGYASKVGDKFPVQRASERMMLMFRNNTVDQPVTIHRYTIAMKAKKLR